MATRIIILVTLMAFALTGCARVAESRFNPLNWFGSGEDAESTTTQSVDPRDPRPLVAQVTGLTIERTPGGAIVRATGLPPMQGWHTVSLVAETPRGEPVEGVMTYSFRGFPPITPTRVSTVQSREVTVARFISNQRLQEIRVIQVVGAGNSRIARR